MGTLPRGNISVLSVVRPLSKNRSPHCGPLSFGYLALYTALFCEMHAATSAARGLDPPPSRPRNLVLACPSSTFSGAAPLALDWTGAVEHSPRAASTQPFLLRLRARGFVPPHLRPRERRRQRSPWPRQAFPARGHPTASPAIQRRLLRLRAFWTRHPPTGSPLPTPRNLP